MFVVYSECKKNFIGAFVVVGTEKSGEFRFKRIITQVNQRLAGFHTVIIVIATAISFCIEINPCQNTIGGSCAGAWIFRMIRKLKGYFFKLPDYIVKYLLCGVFGWKESSDRRILIHKGYIPKRSSAWE